VLEAGGERLWARRMSHQEISCATRRDR
jgi:hypothetical protein